MDKAAPANSSLAAAQRELRLAKRDLERWQSAYDDYRGDDPQKFHHEIREAERRIATARQILRALRRP
jgi:predicted  nucleic acid-binding Zn-ribbon protein